MRFFQIILYLKNLLVMKFSFSWKIGTVEPGGPGEIGTVGYRRFEFPVNFPDPGKPDRAEAPQ